MITPAPDRVPGTRGERWIFGLFLGAVLVLFAADFAVSYAPAKLGGLFILLFWLPLLVTHEAGHAVAARLLGWHVGRIVLGFGRTWHTFLLGPIRVELRTVPITGFVNCVPTHLRQPRLRNALVYFAGPGADLLVAAAVLLLAGPDRLFARSTDPGVIALQALAVAALAQAILNLIPFSTGTAGHETPNDGLGILLSARLPDSHFARQIDDFRRLGPAYFVDDETPCDPDPAEWWKQDRRL